MCTTYIRYTHTSHNNSNPFTASHDKQHVSIRRDEYSREKCDHLLFKRQQHDTHNTQIKYKKIPEIFYLLSCYISTLIFFFSVLPFTSPKQRNTVWSILQSSAAPYWFFFFLPATVYYYASRATLKSISWTEWGKTECWLQMFNDFPRFSHYS